MAEINYRPVIMTGKDATLRVYAEKVAAIKKQVERLGKYLAAEQMRYEAVADFGQRVNGGYEVADNIDRLTKEASDAIREVREIIWAVQWYEIVLDADEAAQVRARRQQEEDVRVAAMAKEDAEQAGGAE